MSNPGLCLELHFLATRWSGCWDVSAVPSSSTWKGSTCTAGSRTLWVSPSCNFGADQELCRQTTCLDLSFVSLSIWEHKQGHGCQLWLPLSRDQDVCAKPVTLTRCEWVWGTHTHTHAHTYHTQTHTTTAQLNSLPQMQSCFVCLPSLHSWCQGASIFC